MGWMKGPGKNGIWGDEPQDAVDAAMHKLYKKGEDKQHLTKVRQSQITKILMADKTLKAKVDKAFVEYWGRKATMAELRYHIKYGM